MGRPAAPMEGAERPSASDVRSGAGRSPSARRTQRSGRFGRLLFFGFTNLWGFVLGAGFLSAAATQAGRPFKWNGHVLAVLAPGAFLAWCSGVALSHLYRVWRERR